MVMNENISRLMDGEVDPAEFERICGEMKAPDAMNTWVCYHVIGDQLRGARGVSPRFATRFCAVLAAEPTVLAPDLSTKLATQLAPHLAQTAQYGRAGQVATAAWAIAATLAAVTVVGWTAFSMVEAPPTAVAKAREATTVRAAQIKPPADIPPDYLLAHQEYSPSVVIQGGLPYLRAVAVTDNEPRP
jgi:sigma-E factor negative regulatory protein RseA